jgi:hypothetical protein
MSRFACPKTARILGRTYRPIRTIQGSRRAVLPVDRLLADVLHPVETYTRCCVPSKRLSACAGHPSPPRTRWRSNSPKQARGVREQPLTTDHLPHMSPSGRLEVLGVRLSPAAYARWQFLWPPGLLRVLGGPAVRWLTHTGREVPPSGLKPNSRSRREA